MQTSRVTVVSTSLRTCYSWWSRYEIHSGTLVHFEKCNTAFCPQTKQLTARYKCLHLLHSQKRASFNKSVNILLRQTCDQQAGTKMRSHGLRQLVDDCRKLSKGLLQVNCKTCYLHACCKLFQQAITNLQVATSQILTGLLHPDEIDKFVGNLLTRSCMFVSHKLLGPPQWNSFSNTSRYFYFLYKQNTVKSTNVNLLV